MASIKILIDYRERAFIDKLKEHEQNSNKLPIYDIQNLDIGDFVIQNEDGQILFIIERKTMDDLASSIIDGRFAQQKDRIMAVTNDANVSIVYILEGHKNTITSKIGRSCINGAIQNMIFKHQFKILFTLDAQDTYDNLLMMCNKCSSGEFNDQNDSTTIAPVNVNLKAGSKKSVINKNIFALQLSVIPGVSYKMACLITQKYKSISELYNCYTNCETEKEKINMLADIQISDKRKLGKSLSKKIYDALI